MLEEKVVKMRQSILDIKAKLDTEIYRKFETKDKIIKECKVRLELTEKKIDSFNKEIIRLKRYEEHSKMMRLKYNESLKEKMEMEELIIQQEERINELSNILNVNENLLKNKSNELKNSEQSCMSLMKLIDEQKKNIKNLNTKFKKREDDEAHRKILFAEKEQEIHFLKNFINSLKSDNLIKEQSLTQMKNKLEKTKTENKQLNSMVQSVEFNKKNLTNFDKLNISENKNKSSIENLKFFKEGSPILKNNIQTSNNNSLGNIDVNEINDENLKEITVLMRKILED